MGNLMFSFHVLVLRISILITFADLSSTGYKSVKVSYRRKCNCGRKSDKVRLQSFSEPGSDYVMGGYEVIPHYSYPWMVYILINNKSECGGSLISRRHVLTAAHCLFDANGDQVKKNALKLLVGEHYKNKAYNSNDSIPF